MIFVKLVFILYVYLICGLFNVAVYNILCTELKKCQTFIVDRELYNNRVAGSTYYRPQYSGF